MTPLHIATEWHLEPVNGRFLYSKSVRKDYLAAVIQHILLYKSDWTTTPSAFDDTNIGFVDTDNTQVDGFVDYLANYFVTDGSLPVLLRGGVDGRYYLMNEFGYEKLYAPPGDITPPPQFIVNPLFDGSVPLGSDVTLTSVASNADSYQWYKDSVIINEETERNLSLQDYSVGDDGDYYVKASNESGFANSTTATLAALAVPNFTTQPTAQSDIPLGSDITLTSVANGADSYQWYKGETAISGETGADLTITGYTASDDGDYTNRATNASGSTNSSTATLAGLALPNFTTQPASQTGIPLGSDVILTSVATNADSYQWTLDGVDIVGETGQDLTITDFALSDNGDYVVVATNASGSTNSSSANISGLRLPTFTTQPQSNLAVVDGAEVVLTSEADRADSYQWTLDGVDIVGETGQDLTIAAYSASDNGDYVVVATNASGSTNSSTATLTLA